MVQRLNELYNLQEHKEEKVKKVFEDLVDLQYIVKVKSHSFANTSSNHPIPSSDRFTIPLLTSKGNNR